MRRPASMLTRLTRLGIAAALGIAMVGMTAGRAAACRCAPLDEMEALAAAQVAFEGVVTQVAEPDIDQPLFYRFVVEQPLKGPIERGEIDVFTPLHLRGCGIEMTAGQRWIIFATPVDATTLTTNACAGNRLADQQRLTVSASPSTDTGPPVQVLVAGAVLLALAGVSAWAFGFLRARRPT